jgi:diguanylate cyclase (GGDEF)-like protein
MTKELYYKSVNSNALICWLIIDIVLIFAYIIEIFKSLRTIQYVILFSIVAIIPLLVAFIINYLEKGTSSNIKYIFSVGYLIFYTFALLTTQNLLTWVYIIPMISIILAYCDRLVTISVFSYTTILNICFILYKYLILGSNAITLSNMEIITFYEIQIACLFLSGLFLYKTTILLKKREDIIDGLESDTFHDPLTGLNNTRFLESNINKKFNIDLDGPLNIAFIDIDDFKNFNTLYGHKFGDKVLISTCNIIKKHIDAIQNTYGIRVGGDEFVIISKSIDDDVFIEVLENIRNDIENTKLEYNDEYVGICVSIGASSKNFDNKNSFLELYNLADDRTYDAKNIGKNVIVSYKK